MAQRRPNRTGLPDSLKSGIENLSGHSMDDVKVHYNSPKPAQLNAHAYAQGTDIHVAAGQEKHLPHEAWHVVQQKQGRVRPTMQMKSTVPVNDDPALEKEADVMGSHASSHSTRTPLHPLTTRNLIGVPQRKPKDMEELGKRVGTYVKYVLDGNKPVIGQVAEVTGTIATIGVVKLTKTKVNGMNFQILGFGESPESFAGDKEIRDVALHEATIDDHLGGFHERFAQHNNEFLTRKQVELIALSTPHVYENFACDPFALAFQQKLKTEKIAYSPLLIVIDIRGVNHHILLNSPGHQYHQQDVGIDNHLATTVVIGGISYVFDNHNPQGVLLPQFVRSLKFMADFVPKGQQGEVILDHAQIISSRQVKIFLAKPENVRSAAGWRSGLLELDIKYNKAYGTFWDEFERNARLVPVHLVPEEHEIRLPKLLTLNIESPGFRKDIHMNYELMINTQRELIGQQLRLIHRAEITGHLQAEHVALLNEMQQTLIEMIISDKEL